MRMGSSEEGAVQAKSLAWGLVVSELGWAVVGGLRLGVVEL